jgi:hypothetical protein
MPVSELFPDLGDFLPHLKTIGLVAAVALGLIALAAASYVLKSSLGPLWRVLQFLFAHTPGERPGELVAGIILGGRMLAWASLIGVVVWFLVH